MVRSVWFISIATVRKVLLASVAAVLVAAGVGPAGTSVRAASPGETRELAPAKDPVPVNPVEVVQRSPVPPIRTFPAPQDPRRPVGKDNVLLPPRSVPSESQTQRPGNAAGQAGFNHAGPPPGSVAGGPDVGACCVGPYGDCFGTTETSCASVGGRFKGAGTECSQLSCRGACCDGTHCSDTGAGDCVFGGGTYQGDGTRCTDLNIACPVGACCYEWGCSEVPSQECVAGGGCFVPGRYCQVVACPGCQLRGACCIPPWSCDFMTRDECARREGTYRGDGSDCSGETCSGACCDQQYCGYDCSVRNPGDCAYCQGTFQGYGTRCTDVGIACQPGACCTRNGDCTQTGPTNCDGTFRGRGTSCEGADCPPAGACCFDGSCFSLTEQACVGDGGNFRGEGSDCSSETCWGACCDSECWGWCEFERPGNCASCQGTFQGYGTRCTDVGIACQTGACCYHFGSCQETREANCAPDNGVFQGLGTTCSAVECPRGACCYPWGSCDDQLTVQGCAQNGGVFSGVGTNCENAACPPAGACCIDYDCNVLTQTACTAQGGNFRGAGTVCDGGTCDGACCDDYDASCSVTTRGNCSGTFRGIGTVCDGADCPLPGACCFEWGGCGEQYTQEDCTGNGGEFQGPGTSCNNVVCPRRVGACCFGDGSCDDLREAACTDRGGQFLGTDRFCVGSGFANSAGGGSPALSLSQNRETRTRPLARDAGSARTSLGIGSYLCPGACCAFSSSACIDSYDQQSCETFFDGVFQGNGTRCTDEAIECPGEYGACCAQFASGPGYGCADGDGVTAFVCALYGVGGQFTPGVDCAQAGCSATICPGEGDCCTPHRSLGCSDAECCRTVCGVDPLCCVQEFQLGSWDAACVQLANRMCGDGNGGYCAVHLADLNGDGIVDLRDYQLFQNEFGR